MPKTYSVKEAASILGFSTNTIYSFLNTKKLNAIRVGKGRFRIPQSEIERITGAEFAVPQQREERMRPIPSYKRAVPAPPITLTDWFIGLGSIIFGLSMFIYTTALDHLFQPQLIYWYAVIRSLLILFGFGYMVSKLMSWVSPVWSRIYRICLVAIYVGFTAVSWLAADPLGVVTGSNLVFWISVDLLFSPSFSVLFTLQFLFVGIENMVFIIFTPQLYASLVKSLGITSEIGIWLKACFVVVPFLAYALLMVFHKKAPRMYYGVVLACSLFCMVVAYCTGIHLYWRQGILYLFIGLLLFAHICFESESMKTTRRVWLPHLVFGCIFVLFFSLLTGLKIFELTMYEYANRELQVKVENGKLYLETVFDYAKQLFNVNVKGQVVLQDIVKKDRTELTALCKTVFEQFPHMFRIVIMDKEGTELANYPEDTSMRGKNFAYRPYFQEAMATNATVFSKTLETADILRKTTIIIATPIMSDGVAYGVLAGSFDFEELGRKLQSFSADEVGEYFSVTDSKGTRLVNVDNIGIGQTMKKEDLQKFGNIPYWKTHLDTRANTENKLVYSTYRTIQYADLNIAVVEPVEENLKEKLIAKFVVLFICLYGYLIIFITWYVSYTEHRKRR